MNEDTMTAVRIIQPANGNPGPLGLLAFAVTTLISNLYNIGAGVPTDNGGTLIVGFALMYGGIVQILAGMWSMKVGNTFEATAFSSFGAYWAAFGLIYWPGSGVTQAYANEGPYALQNATGIFLITWAFLAIILTLSTTKSTVTTVLMFIFLDLHLIFLASNELGHRSEAYWVRRAGAVFGMISAMFAFYNAAAALWLPSNSHIILPVGPLTREKEEEYVV